MEERTVSHPRYLDPRDADYVARLEQGIIELRGFLRFAEQKGLNTVLELRDAVAKNKGLLRDYERALLQETVVEPVLPLGKEWRYLVFLSRRESEKLSCFRFSLGRGAEKSRVEDCLYALSDFSNSDGLEMIRRAEGREILRAYHPSRIVSLNTIAEVAVMRTALVVSLRESMFPQLSLWDDCKLF